MQLIADAVRNRRDRSEATVWDKLFALCFRRLVYTQIWEDPEADLAALELPEGATIVTISSGGCNALSYLTARPQRVYAVDLNDAHLALLKLKLAGLRAFADYSTFWRFFGEACAPSNAQLYRDMLRPLLDANACDYWDERDLLGRPRYAYFTDGFYRHGALGRFIGAAHLLARLAGVDLELLLNAKPGSPARHEALERLAKLFRSRLARLITRTPALLFSLGIPPHQRTLLRGDAPLNDVLLERLLRLINGHPNEDNYFAWQALCRRYPGPGDRCLPPYLQARHFARMSADASRVVPIHDNVRLFLEGLPARHVDAVLLLDSQDWMADEEIGALWNTIDRCGKDSVRVVFRTAGAASPLDAYALAPLHRLWRRDPERSAIGFARDRSGIYGAFHCYQRQDTA